MNASSASRMHGMAVAVGKGYAGSDKRPGVNCAQLSISLLRVGTFFCAWLMALCGSDQLQMIASNFDSC